jgi:hypothetical protein
MFRVRLDDQERYAQPGRAQIRELVNLPYLGPKTASLIATSEIGAICEGEKKGAKFQSQLGIPTLSIGGFRNWVLKEREDSVGRLHPVIREFVGKFKILLLVPDGDYRRPDIGISYRRLADHFEKTEIFLWRAEDKIDDYLVAHPEIRQAQQLSSSSIHEALRESPEGLQRKYFLTGELRGQGRLKLDNNAANCKKLLDGYPGLKGEIKLNTDNGEVEYSRLPGDTLNQLRMYFQANFAMPSLSKGEMGTALVESAHMNQYSPLADWLNGLKWDRVRKFERLLCDVWQAEPTPAHLEVVTKLLIGSVARRLNKGESIMDFMAILQGAQGKGKSGSWIALYGEGQAVEMPASMKGPDLVRALKFNWGVVDNELNFHNLSSSEAMKNAVTTRTDAHRPLYVEKIHTQVRRSVMLGTTDKDQYLNTDVAGYRRWGNIKCGGGGGLFDFKLLASIREQLWAEAVARYRDGESYSNLTLASAAAESLVKPDDVRESVRDYLYRKAVDKTGSLPLVEDDQRQCVWLRTDEFVRVLDLRMNRPATRVSAALQHLGFVKKEQKKIDGVKMGTVFLMPLEEWKTKFVD